MSESKKTIPKRRFKKFENADAWEQRKLGGNASFLKGQGYSKKDLIENGVPIILYGRLYTNYETTIREVSTFVEGTSNSILSKGNEVIVPASGETAEDIARASAVEKYGVILGGDLNIIYPNDNIDSTFLALSISNGQAQRELSSKAQGKSVVHLRNPDLKDLELYFPPIDEQRKISSYFDKVDNLITLHQRKADKLIALKSAYLNEMFPLEGETKPKRRFKGFTGDWEQRKLGELLYLLKDGTHGTHQDVEDGPLLLSAKNIKNGHINWDSSDRRISESEYEKIHSNFTLEKEDILLTIVGSIGETAILKDNYRLTFQRSVAYLRPKSDIKSEFLYSEIQSPRFQKELMNRKSTSAQPGIYLGDLSVITVSYPKNLEEQKQIGRVFGNLNNLITLHQRKVDKLQNLKKAYLNEMFV